MSSPASSRCLPTNLGSLIEVVNRFGSFFYGSILGVFMLAMLTRRASGTGAFVGLIGGMTLVGSVAVAAADISFLWHNVIGAFGVVVVGLLVSLVVPATPPASIRSRNVAFGALAHFVRRCGRLVTRIARLDLRFLRPGA